MKFKISLVLCLICLAAAFPLSAQDQEMPSLDNPMSVDYLKKNLQKSQPRLVYNTEILKNLKKKVKTDPVLQNMYAAIKRNAESIVEKPLLEREMVGRRLLATSGEMLFRINMLGVVYLLEKDPRILARINEDSCSL